MRIGVIIPVCNAAATLGDTLRSVQAQTHRDWHLALVDDGSSDGSAGIAAAFGDPRVVLLRQARGGVSAARNRGLAALDADAFLFLDADDLLAPHALAALAEALAADLGAVAVSGAACFIGAQGGAGTRRALRAVRGVLLPDLLVRNRFANGGHVLLRAAAVRATGGFRTDLRFGEDWEYLIRIALQGHFAAVRDTAPLLAVRERADGAYWQRAADPAAIRPCLDAIFGNPQLRTRFSTRRLVRLRQRAEAEQAWIVGRALLCQGDAAVGRRWLWRSVAAAPSVRRIALLAAL